MPHCQWAIGKTPGHQLDRFMENLSIKILWVPSVLFKIETWIRRIYKKLIQNRAIHFFNFFQKYREKVDLAHDPESEISEKNSGWVFQDESTRVQSCALFWSEMTLKFWFWTFKFIFIRLFKTPTQLWNGIFGTVFLLSWISYVKVF